MKTAVAPASCPPDLCPWPNEVFDEDEEDSHRHGHISKLCSTKPLVDEYCSDVDDGGHEMRELNLAKGGDLLGDFPGNATPDDAILDDAAPDEAPDEETCVYLLNACALS